MYICVIKTPKYIIETGRYIFFYIKSTATMNTFFVYFNLLSSEYRVCPHEVCMGHNSETTRGINKKLNISSIYICR